MNFIDFNIFFKKGAEWLLSNGLRILFIVLFTWFFLKLKKKVTERFITFLLQKKEDAEFQKRTQTLVTIIRYALTAVILAVASMMILKELGINIGPVLAAAGILGVALGFGAQSLVKDILSGFFIILEDQIRVGDVVEIGGKSGLVEKIGLKTTVLRDLAGNVHFVPNGEIKVVTNMTKEYSRYVLDIGVAYKEDVDKVMEVIKEIDEGLRNDPDFKDDIIAPIEVLGVDQFASSSVIIKARTTTMPLKQWRVGREFNRRIKKRFDELGIEIPFPHMTLFMGTDKEGNQPPIRIINESE
ncbi:MAG TPA: mechanosensitive ion channel family protein [Syntrophorhabdaceae bacterium]|nr:mechanosensitive ion channel family protein [Syntrophorhabdaceae bacterium]